MGEEEATLSSSHSSPIGSGAFFRLINDENVASFFSSENGETWVLHSSFDVSGYNHNVMHDFLSLRPAIFASGKGTVTFRSVKYSAM